MEIQNVKLSKIKPYAKNPRINDGAVDAVAASIEQFGFQQPIVVDKDSIIIVGHTRYKAAKKLGLKEVPVVIADGLTEEQVKAYRIADNSTNTLASWDFDLLADELADIPNIDLGEFGLDITMAGEDAEVGMEDIIEDEPPEVNLEEEATVKRGQVWKLGHHRLMCGDSTSQADVEVLMEGNLADMVFTDPPWNVAYGERDNPKWKQRQILNDSMDTEDFKEFMGAAFESMKSALTGGGDSVRGHVRTGVGESDVRTP